MCKYISKGNILQSIDIVLSLQTLQKWQLIVIKIAVGCHSSNPLPSAYNSVYPFQGPVTVQVFAGDCIHADDKVVDVDLAEVVGVVDEKGVVGFDESVHSHVFFVFVDVFPSELHLGIKKIFIKTVSRKKFEERKNDQNLQY